MILVCDDLTREEAALEAMVAWLMIRASMQLSLVYRDHVLVIIHVEVGREEGQDVIITSVRPVCVSLL
jgi:hypothetical protein